MKCQEIKRSLPAYLKGELNELITREIKIHLEQCPLCTSELIREEKINTLLDDWTLGLPGMDISKEIMTEIKAIKPGIPEKVAKTYPKKRRPLNLIQDLAVAAAAALIVFYSSFAAIKQPVTPNYEEKIGVVYAGIENLSSSYIEATTNTTNSLVILFDISKK